ncbi:hypothetical protein [Streptomyces roseoverticillatus]|nr:hypothetical protein [Streptomyces roseoverticillatus]
MLSLGGAVVATPAHADSELAKLVCATLRAGYAPAQLEGCADLE